MKEEKKPAKTKITQVVFIRENGVQVVHPNGKFLRAIQDSKFKGLNSALDSDYHVLGIEDVTASTVGLVLYFKNGVQRHFPYSQISSFTTENDNG
jgi:hypothetical protein